MCKHIKFDANLWAPCKVCLADKQKVVIAKNEAKYLQQIEEYKKEVAELEAKGKKATFAKDEIKMLEGFLAKLN